MGQHLSQSRQNGWIKREDVLADSRLYCLCAVCGAAASTNGCTREQHCRREAVGTCGALQFTGNEEQVARHQKAHLPSISNPSAAWAPNTDPRTMYRLLQCPNA